MAVNPALSLLWDAMSMGIRVWMVNQNGWQNCAVIDLGVGKRDRGVLCIMCPAMYPRDRKRIQHERFTAIVKAMSYSGTVFILCKPGVSGVFR